MVTTAIWLEVLSSYATSFASSACLCSGVSTLAKSLTRRGGLGFGIESRTKLVRLCPNAKALTSKQNSNRSFFMYLSSKNNIVGQFVLVCRAVVWEIIM